MLTCVKQNLLKPSKRRRCVHGKLKYVCRDCGGSRICEHGKQKQQCRDCGGSAICEHGKFKNTCRDCGGSAICEHGKFKYACRDCGGSRICEHGKFKQVCRDCGGRKICEHGKQKQACRDCGGSAICEHGKFKQACRDCGGSAICEHGKFKQACRDCGGSAICEHGKFKQWCRDCGGGAIAHLRLKKGCVECKDWIDWRKGLPHYDGHCYRCFSHKFPGHEKVGTKMRVEHQVRQFIDTHFQEFVHDTPMHTAHCDCNHRRRVDHRRVVGDTLLCIETDEHHHRGYDPEDEQARYHDVIMAWGGKLCFVRFNPDGKGPPIEDRLEQLHAEMTRHIGRLERGENTSYLEVYHLYYPEGTPDCV